MLLKTCNFYPIFTSFHSGWCVLYFKQIQTSLQFSETSILLHKRLYIPPSFRKCSPSDESLDVFWNIHFLPLFHYFQKWGLLILQVNADFLINQLTKYFHTGHLTPLFYFQKEIALSMVDAFKNIHFSLHFY